MKIKAIICTIGLVGVAASAQAGPVGKAPIEPMPEPGLTNLLDPIETTVSVGYDTHYMFRGNDLGQEAPWMAVDFSLPLDLFGRESSLDFGLWYINPTQGGANTNNTVVGLTGIAPPVFASVNNPKRGVLDDELDVYVSYSTTLGPVDVSVGYVHYFLGPEGSANALSPNNDQNEVGITLATSLWILDFGLEYAYNFDAGDKTNAVTLPVAVPGLTGPAGVIPPLGKNNKLQHYWEPSVGTSFDINRRMSLGLSCAAGFYSDQFSHWLLSAALPIQIAENVVFEPYVAYIDSRAGGKLFTGNGLVGTPDTWFGGVSLSVSF